MAFKEMFFVQTFAISSKNRLSLLATYNAINAEQAISRAQAYADRGALGAIAFTQKVDEVAEDTEEPKLLFVYGSVPPEAKATGKLKVA